MRANRFFASRIGPIVFIATSFLTAYGTRAVAEETSDLERRFRDEAPLAWAKLDDSESSIEVVGTMTAYVPPGTARHFRFVRMGDKYLYEFDQEKVSPGGVRCITPARAFVLVRNAADGPWAIKSLGKADARTEGVFKSYFESQFIPLESSATHGCLGTRLSQLVTMPEFRLKVVEPIQRDGLDLARVRYDHHQPAVDQRPGQVADIEVILRPDKLWSVQEVISTLPDGTKATTRLEYGDDDEGLPTLKGLVHSTYFRDGRGTWGTFERADKFSKYSYKPVADEAFTPEAFGLPDPERKVGPAGGWPAEWIFLGLAIAFGVLAVALRVRWPRSGRVQAPAGL